ncbi:amidohydrolase [Guptibacillus hwajinpoensis]|uniref:Amidohydrolase n=1 Tax=Guptibacillus hwajinpoensis TaxID=208199 RepID=A0A0J6CI50_9BACL|nr:amidohydrolase [Alkalihalobacillus macyae]KMM35901.1 amidohydrolase [Alkalihalobacillus macyae]MDP4552270.1 amidohydrolase [Alkalihalobacillus macyae]
MTILIKQARVYPISSTILPSADVLVKDGLIHEVAPSIPEQPEMTVIDGTGCHLLPGLIDAHTHVGLYDEGTGWAGNDANETVEALTPHVRALDGVNPLDVGFKDAIAFGVTSVQVMPGSANIIGGTTTVLKTHGKNVEKMIVRETAGLKIALGENPKRVHSHSNNDSITRMGIMGLLREAFYHASRSDRKEHPRIAPIIAALNREIPVRIHAHRADDILTAVRFAREFDLDLRIEHCTEGHLIADDLSGQNLKVSVGPTMTRRSKIELKNKTWATYGILNNHGIEVSITTDHPYVPIQYLNVCAALAVREGLSEEKALEGITLNPARSLGVDHRIGSIEVGKDADLVLWSHHPFHFEARPLLTMIDGKIIHKK